MSFNNKNQSKKVQNFKEESKKALLEIAKLQNNWDGYGAPSFSNELISKCMDIIDVLNPSPFISPTARMSIQLEYEKANGEYLEFEVYPNKIKMFLIKANKEEIENTVLGYDYIDTIQKAVLDFYNT